MRAVTYYCEEIGDRSDRNKVDLVCREPNGREHTIRAVVVERMGHHLLYYLFIDGDGKKYPYAVWANNRNSLRRKLERLLPKMLSNPNP